jgi:HAD superfamily hydrolase (TIGR01509 family)
MGIKVDPMAKALIFDLDGTLSDSLPLHVANWNWLGRKYGFTFDLQIVHEMTGMPTIMFARRIVEDYMINATPEEIVELKQKLFRHSAHNLKPVKQVVDIVRRFYGQLPMAIGTGASRRSTEVQLLSLNIGHYFETVVTADDVSRHKPDPETFIRCAELMGVEPKFCQVFEDGILGLEAAEKAGMIVTDVRPFINYGDWKILNTKSGSGRSKNTGKC